MDHHFHIQLDSDKLIFLRLRIHLLFLIYYCKIVKYNFIWSVGQEVKTPPSHGGITGSIPVRTVEKMTITIISLDMYPESWTH